MTRHKADRAEVVRETLLSAGIDDLDLDRLAATVTLPDGYARFVWTDTRPDHDTYFLIFHSIGERQRWRAQYEHAKDLAAVAGCRSFDNRPTALTAPACHSSASPDDPPKPGPEGWGSRVSAANRAATATAALDGQAAGPTLTDRGRPSTQPRTK